jgi:hypothetical protein
VRFFELLDRTVTDAGVRDASVFFDDPDLFDRNFEIE